MRGLKILISIALLLVSNLLFAQSDDEKVVIKTTINNLFEGMRKADSLLLKSAFNDKSILQTVATNKDGKTTVRTENLASFIKSVSTPHPEIYDERITFNKILIDGNLASVWTDYKFYIGNKFSHCGVNSFQLVKLNNTWQIVYLIDTRRKDNCN